MYASFGSFIFAYQGQSIFLEIMREMRQPRHFPRAVVSANTALVGVYALTSAVGYGGMGDGVAPFLPSSMPPGPLRQATGLLLAFHVGVGCMIIAQPLHRALHLACFPRTAAGGDTKGAAAHWALLSCSTVLLAIVGDLMSHLASTFGRAFRVTTFGESHCKAVGAIIDGCPGQMKLSETDIQPQLTRRRPGQSRLTTPRSEKDKVLWTPHCTAPIHSLHPPLAARRRR